MLNKRESMTHLPLSPRDTYKCKVTPPPPDHHHYNYHPPNRTELFVLSDEWKKRKTLLCSRTHHIGLPGSTWSLYVQLTITETLTLVTTRSLRRKQVMKTTSSSPLPYLAPLFPVPRHFLQNLGYGSKTYEQESIFQLIAQPAVAHEQQIKFNS